MNTQGGFVDYAEVARRVQACDYLTVAQLFLQDNFLLERELVPADIKPRLLGHWGTCHGINVVYANLAAYYGRAVDFVLGPGHGFPALQANLFYDGRLAEVDPQATRTAEGVAYICRNFSWPGGFPSHASPVTPGVICEGGELGYALATAYGAALGHPEKTVAVLIGDGELETATALASLNLVKLLATPANGRVLPILHLNGYKISAPTVSARKSQRELMEQLRGFGYAPIYLEGDRPEDFQAALAEAERMFAAAQGVHNANGIHNEHGVHSAYDIHGGRGVHEFGGGLWRRDARPPFIILRTQKGAGGPAYVDGRKVAGNYLAHQIPLPQAKEDARQLRQLEEWLKSYHFAEVFAWAPASMENSVSAAGSAAVDAEDPNDAPASAGVEATASPAQTLQVSQSAQAASLTSAPQPLAPNYAAAMQDPATIDHPGAERHSTAEKFGQLIKYSMQQNPHFYLFSPDETTSNKLDAAYQVTGRAWNLPRRTWDLPEAPDGRVVELLSENTLLAAMVGHILGSRQPAVMASYEAFFSIVTSQILQHIKFLEQAADVAWRPDYPALNLLSTSTCWRQDHNGFSHQSPALISTLLSVPSGRVNCLFPVDDIAATAAYQHLQSSRNVVNLVTFNKTPEPRWIDARHAEFQYTYGASIYGFASDEQPDYVLTAAGDIPTREALYAMQILRQDLPGVKLRFVGINALSYGAIGTVGHAMPAEIFAEYFTSSRPIIANFHGYAATLKGILANYAVPGRILAHGFAERGSTTTPFEMLSLNHASRYHLAMDVATLAGRTDLVAKYQEVIRANAAYARAHGVDLPELL